MNRDEILKKLQEKNKSFRLPSDMDFNIEDNVLTISMTKKGLTANMQTDASAFEGWAICLKAWLPDKITHVVVDGVLPPDTKDKHYQRFLYRLKKFTKIYSWASTVFFKKELDNFMKNENIVINVPKSEASESAFHCEAQLERAFCQENKFNYETIDHQLPVRLFNGEIQEANAITPKGYLDIWSIKEDLLRIFELKLPTNTEIGIISELMFYVNVMTDVINGEIKIPFSSEDKSYRSFERLFNFQKNKEGKKIEGVFLADNFHPMIEEKKEEIKRILDDGYLGNGISELKVNFSFEKPKVNDYCPANK